MERRLAGRRLAALGVRTGAVAAALALAVSGFTYWQVRVPLDGVRRAHGAPAAAARLAVTLAAFALAGGVIAGHRQSARIAAPPGPEWLALPVEPGRVVRHLQAEARLPALAALPPGLAALAAGAGLVPPAWLGLGAAAFLLAWLEFTRLACALGRRLAGPRAPRALPRATRLLLAGRTRSRPRSLAPPRWRAEPAWRALARLDAATTARPGPLRARAAWALAFAAASLAAWASPAPALEARAQAFVLFMCGCALLGAWALAAAAGGPAPILRPLPLSLADAWRARALPLALLVVAALLAHGVLALPLAPAARAGVVLAWLGPALLVSLLGLHYGLTVPGQARAIEPVYYGWLGVGVIASLMIPFVGWGVLLGGFAHATRRLPRWWRPEVG